MSVSVWQNWLRTRQTANLKKPVRRRSRWIPVVEPLEDRMAPAVFSVTVFKDGVDGSLRDMINQANENPGIDAIIIPDGIFPITLVGAQEDENETGDFDITGPTVFRGAGKFTTIIDANGLDRVFHSVSGAPVTFADMTIREGEVATDGGGIYVDTAGTNVSLNSVLLTDNHADLDGGGLYVTGGTAVMLYSKITRNTAGGDGGGFWADGAGTGYIKVAQCVISLNEATNGGGFFVTNAAFVNFNSSTVVSTNTATADGGGFAFDGDGLVTLLNSIVRLNEAGGNGGGANISNTAADFTMLKATLSANHAVGDGGGLWFTGDKLSVQRSTIDHNTAVNGAGAWVDSIGITKFENSTISTNAATEQGGGVFVNAIGVSTTFDSCTVAYNNAGLESGGGIFNNAIGATSVGVQNSIIAKNWFDAGQLNGIFDDLHNNLLAFDDSANTAFTSPTNIVGTIADPFNPLLSPLGFWGGPNKTHHLITGSYAINNGDTDLVVDQSGNPRPNGSGDDIGATEKPGQN